MCTYISNRRYLAKLIRYLASASYQPPLETVREPHVLSEVRVFIPNHAQVRSEIQRLTVHSPLPPLPTDLVERARLHPKLYEFAVRWGYLQE